MNFKNTPVRSSLINFFMNSAYPVDVLEIISFLKSKKLNTNKVTVYRNLEVLYKNGIIDKLEFGEGKFRYELKKKHHHHLICTMCKNIEDIEEQYFSRIEENIKDKNDFIVKNHTLEFFGICRNCQF